MAHWTILGKTNSKGDVFGLTLDIDKSKWLVGGPGAGNVFQTKSGVFVMKPASAKETILLGEESANAVVANLRNLTMTSSVDDTGDGYQQETATNFKWRLESK